MSEGISRKHAPATSTLRGRLVREVWRIKCAFKLVEKAINISDNRAGAEVQVFVVGAKGNEVSVAAPAASVGKWDTRRGAPVGRHRGPRFDAHLGGAQRGALIGITVPVAAHTNSGQPSPPHTSREHAVVVVSIVTGAATSGIVTVVMAAIIGTSGTVVPLPRLPGPVAAAASLIRPSASAPSSARPIPSFPRPPPTTTTL